MSSTGLLKTPEKSRSCENRLELETHQSSTRFCDMMMSPDEWQSSLPLILQQHGVPTTDISVGNYNSPASPSISMEDFVLELDNSSQDELGSPFSVSDNMLPKGFSSIEEKPQLIEEEVVSMDTDLIADNLMGGVNDNEGKLLQNDEPSSIVLIGLTTKDTDNKLKSSDPLSMMLTNKATSSVNECNTHPLQITESSSDIANTETGKEKIPSIAPIEQKVLVNRLAEVVHCNNRESIENINKKAVSTISTLKQQACELMSTYAQLKLQNDELIQKQNQLHPEQFLAEPRDPFNIEVLVIPSGESKKAFGKTTLYHHIPILEDGQIPTFSADDTYSDQGAMEDTYVEIYDAQSKLHPDFKTLEISPCQNKKLPCEMGCVCSSLMVGKLPVEHCKNPNCMLETTPCTQLDDPSHTPKIVCTLITTKGTCNVDEMDQLDLDAPISKPTRSRSKVSASRSDNYSIGRKIIKGKSHRASEKPKKDTIRWDSRVDKNDPKLKQECYVLLTKLVKSEDRKKVNLTDVKLRMKECYVHLKRIEVKPDQSTYCMVHRLRYCTCLLPTPMD